MNNTGDSLKDLKLNREERRKMQRDIAKKSGKKKEDVTVQDVIEQMSKTRKKNNRRK